MDVTEIERRVDRAIAAPIAVNMEIGGVALQNMGEVMEFAKLMAVSGSAVPKYLRGNPGGCLAICSRALRWQMDPFAVAEKSYQVVNKGEERIAFEAQLVHAVITARAPLKTRLRYEILGEGDERRCRVWGTFRGEDSPHAYTSETLAKLRDARGRNEYGNIKGSPLWDAQPEVQLAYSSIRQWCRLHASEVMLGVYTPDELEDGSKIKDVTPQVSPLQQRLRDAKKAHAQDRGFDAEHIAREVALSTIIEEDANPGEQEVTNEDGSEGGRDATGDEGRQDAVGDRGDDAVHQGGSDGSVDADQALGDGPAGSPARSEEAEEESNLFPPDRKPKQTGGKGKGTKR
jgi:predicted transcriptional regulator